jgi:acetolactate synthase-1/2/3 large subunit
MGYGLSGAIGAALAKPSQTTFLFEGDGGFAQNLQELGTVSANQNNLKIFLFANDGYASIRMTQRNYFDGAWVGCDSSTGLGLPDWNVLAKSFGLRYIKLSTDLGLRTSQLQEAIDYIGPVFIEVPIDPNQTYFPKIASRVLEDGSMKSNPLHRMEPPVPKEIGQYVFRYLSD